MEFRGNSNHKKPFHIRGEFWHSTNTYKQITKSERECSHFFGRNMNFNLIFVAVSSFFLCERYSPTVVNEETLFITIGQFFISFHRRLSEFFFVTTSSIIKNRQRYAFMCACIFTFYHLSNLKRSKKRRKIHESSSKNNNNNSSNTKNSRHIGSSYDSVCETKNGLAWFRHVTRIGSYQYRVESNPIII